MGGKIDMERGVRGFVVEVEDMLRKEDCRVVLGRDWSRGGGVRKEF